MPILPNVGFIGTGSIAAAVVAGLSSKPAAPRIHLSPRSEITSKALAAKFPNAHRETSNADVVAKSEVVMLAVRPEHLRDALSGVSFHPGQYVASFVATLPLAEIARMVTPATVCRVTPLTFIEKSRGPVVMYPALSAIEDLFDGLGEVLIAETEEQMTAFGCAASVLSTFLEIEHTVAQWLTCTGVKPEVASLYVRSMFAGLARGALENESPDLRAMVRSNETPGGLNERVRLALCEHGLFSCILKVLSDLAAVSLSSEFNK